MHSNVPFAVWSRERQRRIEDVLVRALSNDAMPAPARLGEAMRYAALDGGKRVRPLLAYAAGEAVNADPADVDCCAGAVELIHAYSLVHDDLPCMDNDALRRGKPSCHVAFGEATALLAGDALQARAFALVAQSGLHDTGVACALLAEAAGASGMAGGQAIDLDAAGGALDLSGVTAMHRMKTGAIIRASVQLGARCGDALVPADTAALDAYADAIGLAFQIVDDLIDVEGTAELTGKTTGKDAANAKPTFVSLLGLAGARSRADALRSEAHAALASFADRARRLSEIADWIVDRDF
ncbi:MAG TPA: farnesyl diphosphate synthase [Casimicrobiaceae bacterium]|jgi:farnesyl diphosphate synthase